MYSVGAAILAAAAAAPLGPAIAQLWGSSLHKALAHQTFTFLLPSGFLKEIFIYCKPKETMKKTAKYLIAYYDTSKFKYFLTCFVSF